mmetsp:Transcript_31510/g.79666  ORF Transcript_31510/g.79666 Transcript_31510/m.79666 type:complete len:422 (+) Transcript_31510:545-1810(+)
MDSSTAAIASSSAAHEGDAPLGWLPRLPSARGAAAPGPAIISCASSRPHIACRAPGRSTACPSWCASCSSCGMSSLGDDARRALSRKLCHSAEDWHMKATAGRSASRPSRRAAHSCVETACTRLRAYVRWFRLWCTATASLTARAKRLYRKGLSAPPGRRAWRSSRGSSVAAACSVSAWLYSRQRPVLTQPSMEVPTSRAGTTAQEEERMGDASSWEESTPSERPEVEAPSNSQQLPPSATARGRSDAAATTTGHSRPGTNESSTSSSSPGVGIMLEPGRQTGEVGGTSLSSDTQLYDTALSTSLSIAATSCCRSCPSCGSLSAFRTVWKVASFRPGGAPSSDAPGARGGSVDTTSASTASGSTPAGSSSLCCRCRSLLGRERGARGCATFSTTGRRSIGGGVYVMSTAANACSYGSRYFL